MNNNNEWEHQAIKLANTGVMSWRDIAQYVGVPKSTVSDKLRAYFKLKNAEEAVQSKEWPACESHAAFLAEDNPIKLYGGGRGGGKVNVKEGVTHLYIPDNQVKPGVDLSYLEWIGKYIVRKRPDVIINGGDFADMESLSSYDKGKRAAEGKRVQEDIDAAVRGMEILLKPLRELQEQQRLSGEVVYAPRMVLTLGNHEERIDRHVNANPELHGFLNIENLKYEEFGWEVVPFLEPIIVDGVSYCHYFPNAYTGKPMGGSAANMMKTIGCSFTQGHKQTLDVTTRFLPSDGKQQWGIVAGACYLHEENYKGKQGNRHWRGIIVKHNVKDGSYDPLFISLDWLKKEYGG